jgi:hypothetical protein
MAIGACGPYWLLDPGFGSWITGTVGGFS